MGGFLFGKLIHNFIAYIAQSIKNSEGDHY
jgi:hypothetical protein